MNQREDVLDTSDVEISILIDAPRAVPTLGIHIQQTDVPNMTFDRLQSVADELSDEMNWSMGYEKTIRHSSGGIGGDGLTVLSLILGAIGAYPTITQLFKKIGGQVPQLADEPVAWESATWAVAMQFERVQRRELRCLESSRHMDYWEFLMGCEGSPDRFRVQVYGPDERASAQMVTWIGGDPWGDGPSSTRESTS